MPSSSAEPSASVENSNVHDASKEKPTSRRRLKNKPQNELSEPTTEKPAKKAVKRKPAEKLPEKKPRAKSTKPRVSRGKQPLLEERQHMLENSQAEYKPEKNDDNNSIDDDEEDMEEGEIPSSIAAESKTYYSCKLCHKDFSSAFILCLHLQIHEKVANTPEIEDTSIEVIEEERQEDAVGVGSHIVTETGSGESEVEESSIRAEDCPPVGILNKNFVENLKKNLSLAMNRNP